MAGVKKYKVKKLKPGQTLFAAQARKSQFLNLKTLFQYLLIILLAMMNKHN